MQMDLSRRILCLSAKKATTNKFQLTLVVQRQWRNAKYPNASVVLHAAPERQALQAVIPHCEYLLNVPECSQMVYPDGGEVWVVQRQLHGAGLLGQIRRSM